MLSSELREKACQYVDNRISLPELEEWLVPNLPYYLSSPDSDDADVVSALELGFADVSNRTRSQAEFRSDLRSVLDQHTVSAVTAT